MGHGRKSPAFCGAFFCHPRDTQLTLAAVRFGNQHFAYRTGPLAALQQRLAEAWPLRSQHELGVRDVESVHPGSALVGLAPLPCRLQVLSRERRL